MFGDTLRKLREQNKLTLAQLADKLSIDKSYLSRLENYERPNPSLEIYKNICSIFGLTMDEFQKQIETDELVLKIWAETFPNPSETLLKMSIGSKEEMLHQFIRNLLAHGHGDYARSIASKLGMSSEDIDLFF